MIETAVIEGGAMGAEEAAYNASLFGTELSHEAFVVDSASEIASAAQSAAAAPCIILHLPEASMVDQALEATEASGAILLNAGSIDDALRQDNCHPRLFHVAASHAQHVDALVLWLRERESSSITVLTGERGDAPSAYAASQLEEAGFEIRAVVESPAEVGDGAVWVTPTAQPGAFSQLDPERLVLAPHVVPEAAEVAHGPVLWHESLFKYGATQVSDRFSKRARQPMDGIAYANWLAMQIAADAMAQTGSTDPEALRQHLRTVTRFDGRKAAPISFRSWNQQARHELYVRTPDPEAPIEASIPKRMPDAPDAQIQALDALGVRRGACSL
jgi:ABC-type branched-subunit amino acid transport system substrate-binding protein